MNLPPAKLERFNAVSARIRELSTELGVLMEEYRDLMSWSETSIRKPRQQSAVQIILKLTSDHYEVSIPDILGRRKFATIIEARQVMFWLLKRTCQLSWNETARLVGVKDHGTILHAVRRVTDRRDVYPDFRTDTDHLLAIAQAAIPSIHRPINEKPPTA